MVEFVIILTASLVIVAVLFAARFPQKQSLISVILIGVGLFFIISRGAQLKSELGKTAWPTVVGRVTTSDVIGARAYHPEVRFEYSVGGQMYASQDNLSTPGFGSKSKRREVAVKSLVQYPPGAEVKVRYNPRHPAEGYIHVGPTHGDYIGLSFGLLLLCGGVVLVTKFRR